MFPQPAHLHLSQPERMISANCPNASSDPAADQNTTIAAIGGDETRPSVQTRSGVHRFRCVGVRSVAFAVFAHLFVIGGQAFVGGLATAADDRNIENASVSNSAKVSPTTSLSANVDLKKEMEDEIASLDDDDDSSVQPVDSIGPGKQPPASLQPLIELAEQAKKKFETEVDGYTCLLVKRETIDGKLESTKYIRLKIRERRTNGEQLIQPQCIYGKFLKPKDVAGREVLYVENERDGDVLVRRGGTRLPNLTLEINPEGRLAKQESNYSFVQTGIRPMIEQILDRMQSQIDPSNVKIRFYADAKVDGRPCQHIEVNQIERRPDSAYQVAKVYVDEELKLPVFFSSYAWPDEPGEDPVLQEQYAITQINLTPNLTDLDFDRTNPEYKFHNEEE
ncbi:DUF1571 domain-containing protein [Rhodopirellula sp. SWK7]|uniref:DUF1571 domain-containing protein n=1 Tax=Rhodopirellula sp. SWK7 TaxID=595460 RepID=UPI001F2C8545|nr:DUF1571 domain-containing protein [Rhodopirellula sp. SWK7]